MKKCSHLGIVVIVCIFSTNCVEKKNSIKNDTPKLAVIDSVSKSILQTFALSYSEQMQFDSSSLLYYRSSSYDTSFLLQIKYQDNLIKGTYYEILPEYHRFKTDYADRNSQLIFFEGYSFVIDSVTWLAVSKHAKLVLMEDMNQYSKKKYTDGATYGLYYSGSSIHGDSNSQAPFEKFYTFLRVGFLDKYFKLRKPIMVKNK